MSPKRHPFHPWIVAGGLIAAVAIALGTIGDATSTWHDFLIWVNGRLHLGENSFLLSNEKLLFLLALMAGAVLLGLFKWTVSRLAAPVRDRGLRRGRTKEERTRAAYLDYLEEDVNGRLAASIHRARFLDLGLDEAQGATLPWHYVHHDPDAEAQVFTSIDEAFDGFKSRLLLLGAPGAGKSTTLLHLARRLLEEAKNNLEAPIPVLLSLSSYKGPAPKRRFPFLGDRKAPRTPEDITAFDRWLVQQLEGLPALRKLARSWVEEGRIALLLDGLDEVAESRVSDLIRDLNESFFWHHPDLPVVVCSRIFEYQRIAEDREMRLRLQGAVTLQPLAPEQVDLYLTAARAEGLRDALLGDAELRELARTPLTLSMMVLSYGGLAPTEIPVNLPLVERRRHLFDIYMARMLQRKERRDRGQPFDLNPEVDVPLTYPIDPVNRYLGWLAIRLSERSLTGFRPEGLVSLLGQGSGLRIDNPAWTPVRFALLLFSICLSLVTAILLLGLGDERFSALLLFAFLMAPVGFCTSDLIDRTGDGIVSALGGVLVFCAACLAIGFLGSSILTVLSLPSDPFWANYLIVLIAATVFHGFQEGLENLRGALVRGAIWGVIVLIVLLLLDLRDLLLWAPALGGAVTVSFFVLDNVGSRWIVYAFAPFVAISASLLSWGGVFAMSIVGARSDVVLMVLICWLLGYIMDFAVGEFSLAAVGLGLAVGSVLGMATGGVPAVPLAAAVVALLAFGKWREQVTERMESYLLNPFLLTILALQKCAPWRFYRFIGYATDAMLLKRSGGEYEFVHRLLRDHFAVRELIPFLHATDGRVRPEVIEQLSLLGEASLDSLSSLTCHSDEAIRAVAVGGLANIRSPNVTSVLTRVVVDERAPKIRAIAVRALGQSLFEDVLPLMQRALLDPAPEVRAAVMELAGTKRFDFRWAKIIGHGLHDPDDQVFALAVQVLGQTSGSEITSGIVTIPDGDGAAPVLARIRSLLDDPSASNRWVALRLVGSLRDQESLPQVQAATAAKDKRVRLAALFALGQISGPEAIPVFMPLLRSWWAETRRVAVEALADISWRCDSQGLHDEVRTALLRALRDRSGEVKAAAAFALGIFRHPTVEAALEHALRDRDRTVSMAARTALKRLRQESRLSEPIRGRPSLVQ